MSHETTCESTHAHHKQCILRSSFALALVHLCFRPAVSSLVARDFVAAVDSAVDDARLSAEEGVTAHDGPSELHYKTFHYITRHDTTLHDITLHCTVQYSTAE